MFGDLEGRRGGGVVEEEWWRMSGGGVVVVVVMVNAVQVWKCLRGKGKKKYYF